MLSLGGGCAPGLSPSEAADLRRRLDESQRTSQAALRKAEELEDRVFLLTDQIESQKIAASRGKGPVSIAALPVVTLRPQVAAEEHVDDPSDPNDPANDIEFRGSAGSARPAQVRTTRPLLTGEGSGMGSLGSGSAPATKPHKSRTPSVPVEVPNSHDSLGVAAAPPIATSKRSGDVPAIPTAAAPSSAGMAGTGDDAARLYRTATAALRAGQHDEAERLFRDLVKRFPHHDYADNAQYWLGECFYDRKRYAEAASEFQMVLANYPSGNKAPDAMLKLALCLTAMGDSERGAKMLRTLPQTYPRTDAARIAEEKLASELRGKESR